MNQYDLIIIGGGIAGMTSALSALENGVKKILLLEREDILGGVLNQCIHNNFGRSLLKAKITGPEYINFIKEKVEEYKNIDIKLSSQVLSLDEQKIVTYVNPKEGVVKVSGKVVILATGCREKYTGSIVIPTNSFTGIFTVGNAHRVVNIEGYLPGKSPVIVVNNKWALIVARRLTIEGANIKALIIDENEDFNFDESNKSIIDGFDIPVIRSSRIVEVFGEDRIKGVKVFNKETEKSVIMACDSLILSVGYFPEIDFIKDINIDIDEETMAPIVDKFETSIKGIFACGNLIYGTKALKEVDIDGIKAGIRASEYVKEL